MLDSSFLLAATTQPWPIFDRQFLGNSLRAWSIAGGTLLVLWLVSVAVKWLTAQRLARIADRTATRWDNVFVVVIRGVRLGLVAPLLIYISTRSLVTPETIDRMLRILAVVGISAQVLMSCRIIIDVALGHLAKSTATTEGSPDPTISSSMSVLRLIALAVVSITVVMLALDNLGIEITPMLTGLGIGGIAVALAVQSILGDLFGSVTIILDKPFVVGDFIIIGDKLGTVEKIGIKTTRLRSLSGEQLVLANSDLLSSRIQNFKRMQQRRVLITIGVIYETPGELLRQIPGVIKATIEKQANTRFDRAHFKGYGAYSLDFEAVYFVLSADYNVFMDVNQAVNFELFDRFKELGIQFAYPTSVQVYRRAEEERGIDAAAIPPAIGKAGGEGQD